MKKTILCLTLSALVIPSAFAQRWSSEPVYANQPSAGSIQMPQLPDNLPPQIRSQIQQAQIQQAQMQQIQNPGQIVVPTIGSLENNANTNVQAQEVVDDKPPVEDLEAQRLLFSVDFKQDARQAGEKLMRPNHNGFALSTKSEDQLRFKEWNRHLLNVGIPQSKIDFEGRRLNRSDFELWASRIVWWEEGVHPNHLEIK